MRTIDMQTWARRRHFELYHKFDHPRFSLCANVDLTTFYPYLRQHAHSFTVAIIYLIARTANAIPEFRYRIRGEAVVEHEVVHPSTTILTDEELFSFCTVMYVENFPEFAERAARRIAAARQRLILEDEPGRDDYLFMTSIPWVSFTSFEHPTHLNPSDSVPRFAWGKLFEDGKTLKMPFSVQVHHSLMDGLHVGRYYARLQEALDNPEEYLGESSLR